MQSAWHAFKQSQSQTPKEITKADLLAFVLFTTDADAS
jgi:hypothetical protein